MKYRNAIVSGQFIMPIGTAIIFKNGEYETTDAKEIEELDKCVKTPGTTISHFDAVVHSGPQVDVKPEKLAEAAAAILAAHANVNPNSIDPKLQELLERAKRATLGAVTTADVKDAAKG